MWGLNDILEFVFCMLSCFKRSLICALKYWWCCIAWRFVSDATWRWSRKWKACCKRFHSKRRERHNALQKDNIGDVAIDLPLTNSCHCRCRFRGDGVPFALTVTRDIFSNCDIFSNSWRDGEGLWLGTRIAVTSSPRKLCPQRHELISEKLNAASPGLWCC